MLLNTLPMRLKHTWTETSHGLASSKPEPQRYWHLTTVLNVLEGQPRQPCIKSSGCWTLKLLIRNINFQTRQNFVNHVWWKVMKYTGTFIAFKKSKAFILTKYCICYDKDAFVIGLLNLNLKSKAESQSFYWICSKLALNTTSTLIGLTPSGLSSPSHFVLLYLHTSYFTLVSSPHIYFYLTLQTGTSSSVIVSQKDQLLRWR